MDTASAARLLSEIGDLLELKGENAFRIRAYREGAEAIARLGGDLRGSVESGEILSVRGIGKGLLAELTALVETGTTPLYQELRRSFPEALLELLAVPGLGPKRIKALHEGLGIASLADLEAAVRQGRIAGLKGFGAKTADKVARSLAFFNAALGQSRYADAIGEARLLLAHLRAQPAARRCELAGAIRRACELVTEIALVVSSDDADAVSGAFAAYPGAVEVLPTRVGTARIRLARNLEAQLRVVPAEQFAHALLHDTGAPEHFAALVRLAADAGLRLDERGLFRRTDGFHLACRSEEEIYAELEMAWIPPELREGTWEVEAARRGELPDLVRTDQIRGTFHAHTVASDGHATLEQMIAAARAVGLAYLGISDHSQAASYAGGLDAVRLAEQHAAIDAIAADLEDFVVFKGIEADILRDGTVDMGATTLETCDFVVASIHSRFNESGEEMTDRICRALADPHVTMLGHISGRLLLEREAYELDFERVFETAARYGVLIEINSTPSRLELDWRWLQRAKAAGVRFSINPDAHNTTELANVPLGVAIARKGGLEAADLLNTRTAAEVRDYLARRKQGDRIRLA